jgi:hypothetical protein
MTQCRRYLADVESLDDGVDRLLKRLDELGFPPSFMNPASCVFTCRPEASRSISTGLN